ncbi:MAG: spore coat protein U domain-containing protein [Terracidiphilus sp.]|jgi:spore coat protein U-like protein
MMRRLALAALVTLLICCARQAAAQGNCTLTDTELNFGVYTGATLDSTSNGTVTCTNQRDGWNIPLDAGTGVGATEAVRKLTGPGGVELNYAVYQYPGYTTIWGNNTAGTTEVTGTGNTTVHFDGQITAGQVVPPGTYTDTLSTDTTSFTVTVVILANCTVTASNLAFGTYTGALINSTSTISVTCTDLAPYNVGLNAGTSTGATVTTRKMTGPGAALLNYKLFSDAGHSINWGNTVGTDTVTGTGTGAVQALTVYGQLPAGQTPARGAYSDTITVTVTY